MKSPLIPTFSLQFSRDRHFGEYSFSQVKRTAEELEYIAGTYRNQPNAQMHAQKTIVHKGLKSLFSGKETYTRKQKTYSLNQFDEREWNTSSKLEFKIMLPQEDDESFMLGLSHDSKEPGTLLFSGRGLDEKVYEAVMSKFCKAGHLYSVKDMLPRIPIEQILLPAAATEQELQSA